MRITKTQPEPVYTLELDHVELHELYHTMLATSHRFILTAVEEEFLAFLAALAEHA